MVDKTEVVKLAKELYKSKGTPASYQLLFRILYNMDVDFFYTKDAVLKASNGKWYVSKSLKLSTDLIYVDTISYSGSSTVLGTIGRVVLYEMDALHHFEVDGVYVDPLLGYLQGYIGGGSNNVVTNSEYETKLNDNKRLIYIPTISVARRIESEYSTLMTQ